MSDEFYERELEWRQERYPNKGDPRRRPGFNEQSDQSQTSDLLGAILDVLNRIASHSSEVQS
jgi:hypothetical protein